LFPLLENDFFSSRNSWKLTTFFTASFSSRQLGCPSLCRHKWEDPWLSVPRSRAVWLFLKWRRRAFALRPFLRIALVFFDALAGKDIPGNRSRPGLHWLKFVVCRAGIAPTENLVCLEASPVFQRARSLSSEGVVTGEGLFFWPFILLASCLPWPFCPEPELFHSNF
jgi:hypothetical protein